MMAVMLSPDLEIGPEHSEAAASGKPQPGALPAREGGISAGSAKCHTEMLAFCRLIHNS
jgi:hypothetical protein